MQPNSHTFPLKYKNVVFFQINIDLVFYRILFSIIWHHSFVNNYFVWLTKLDERPSLEKNEHESYSQITYSQRPIDMF